MTKVRMLRFLVMLLLTKSLIVSNRVFLGSTIMNTIFVYIIVLSPDDLDNFELSVFFWSVDNIEPENRF